MAVNPRGRERNLRTISLGRVLGIPIGVHYSWFTILVLLTWALAVGYYPAEFQGGRTVSYWIMGALTAILLFVTVLLHELGHAIVALHYQVPVRDITLFIFGGVAQIDEEPPSAAAEFWIAVAGPLASFSLAAAFGLLQSALSGVAPLFALIRYLACMNGTLALFNLIPGFPLDGGRVFRAIVWAATHNLRRATLIAANLGRGVSLLLVVLGVWQMVIGNLGTGLWIAFTGWFLETVARTEVQQQTTQSLLAGHRALEAMDPDMEIPRSEWPATPTTRIMTSEAQVKPIGPDSELWAVFQEMDHDGVTQLPVMANGQIVGMLTREGIMRFLRTLQELGHNMGGA
ncbi:MAG: site-2 protease family protein [Anaerolineae bacterium]|nr:site-2 protease family protein [Anaerolineae bacterium]